MCSIAEFIRNQELRRLNWEWERALSEHNLNILTIYQCVKLVDRVW